jgi:hypothetical protein
MIDNLKKLEELRGSASLEKNDADFFARVKAVKAWQQLRLKRTYPDLAADARYAPATAFFMDELYGIKDSALRDRDLIRMYPTIQRVLPQFAYDAVSKALELDVISEEFDQMLAKKLDGAAINEKNYAEAFREAGSKKDRLHQVDLMRAVGAELDVVVKKPLIYSTLRMLRTPARLAGLSNMQQFLEAGFTAFRHMNGAEYFLHTIAERETLLIERLYSRHPDPFEVSQENRR